MEQIIVNALQRLATDSPVIVIVAYAAWDLRKNLINCINHNEELMDRLLEIVLKDK
jgi:hypothetical protein